MKIPFNIKQGLSTELRNQSLVEGTMYYCTDTNEFYIDVKDPNNNNVLTRFCLNDSTIYWEEIFNKPIEEINKHLYTINLTEDEIVEGYYTKSSSSSTQYPIQFIKLKNITTQHINEGFQMVFPSLNANIDSSILISSTPQQNVTVLSLGEIDLVYIVAQNNIEITGKNIILNTGVWLRTINEDIEEENSSMIGDLVEESLIPSFLYFNKPITSLNLFTKDLVNIDWNESNPLSSQTIKNKPYGLIQSEDKDTFYSNLEYSDYFIPLSGDLEAQNMISHFMTHQNGYLLPQSNNNTTRPENFGQFIPLQFEDDVEDLILGYNFISSQIPPQDKIINSIVKQREDVKAWVDYNLLASLLGGSTGIDFSFLGGASADPVETIKEIKSYNIYINENYCGINLNATEQNPASADLSTFSIIIIYTPNTTIENTSFEKAGIYFAYGYTAVQVIFFGVSGKTGVTEWKIPGFTSNQVFNKKITKSQIEKDTFSEIGHLHPEACSVMSGFMSPRQAQILQNTKRIRHTSTSAGYYKLGTMLPDSSSNNDVGISFEGWIGPNSVTLGYINVKLLNRTQDYIGDSIFSSVQTQYINTPDFFNYCDIEIYSQSDKSCDIYLKSGTGACLFDTIWSYWNHNISYDSKTSSPSGTLIWSLSTAPKTELDNISAVDTSQFAPASHNHDDRYYTETESNKNYYGWERGALDIDTRYDMKLSMLAKGLNLPASNGYGVCLTMPYRESTGNSKPDFGAQIFVPNGDDDVYPNSMFYRTALSDTWNDWQEVATVAQLNQKAPAYTYGTTDLVEGQSTLPVGTLYFVFEE